MKTTENAVLNILVFAILTLSACKSTVESDSMQPAEGYPFTSDLEEIHDILKFRCIDTIDFKSGQVIADIGAGNGYIEAMLAMFNDSLTFYIQDIDISVCNESELSKVLDFYQEVNGKPFTSKFIIVNGSDTDTNLPDDTFDKILMLWTYSYLKEPIRFISDIRKNLKDDGLFYVINPEIEENDYTKSLRKETGWNVSTMEKQIDDIISCGFRLVRISKNYDAGDYQEPVIMIFRKANNSKIWIQSERGILPEESLLKM